MPTYKMKAPDGKTYSVPGPDGASDADVRAEILRQHPEAAAPKAAAPVEKKYDPTEGMSTFDKVAAGAGKAVMDTVLGGQQLVANLPVVGQYLGDKDALNAEAAERERLDAALMNTGAGMVGNIAGNVAITALPFGAATKVTQGARMIPKAASILGLGAAQGLLTPDEDYSPAWQAGKGAAFNVAGEGVGRVVAGAAAPAKRMIPQIVKDSVAELADYPALLAAHTSGNKTIKALTNALEQIPGFGGGIKSAREKNLGRYTESATEGTGMRTDAFTPDAARRMEDSLKAQLDTYSNGPDIPIPNLSSSLQPKLAEARAAAELLPGNRGVNVLDTAIEGGKAKAPPGPLTEPSIYKTLDEVAVQQPTAPVKVGPQGQELAPGDIRTTLEQVAAEQHGPHGYGQPGPPPFMPITPQPEIPTLPAKLAVTLRSIASDTAHGMADSPKARLEQQAWTALRDELGDAIGEAQGPGGKEAFKALRDKWGRWADLKKVAPTDTGRIRPEDMLGTFGTDAAEKVAPRTPFERETVAAAHLLKSPSLSENRSLMVRALMGAGFAAPGAAIGGLSSGDLAGTGAGAASSLALASLLLGTPAGGRYLTGQAKSVAGKALQSEEAKRLARLLGISTAQAINQ